MITKLDKFLSNCFSLGYWQEVIIEDAEKLLNQFSLNDWEELKSFINDKDEEWLERLVEVLSEIESQESLCMLLLLMKKDLKGVKIMALDSIFHILEGMTYELDEYEKIELKQAVSTINNPSIIEKHVISLISDKF